MTERCDHKKCSSRATTICHMTDGSKKYTCRPCATKLLAHGRAILTADVKKERV